MCFWTVWECLRSIGNLDRSLDDLGPVRGRTCRVVVHRRVQLTWQSVSASLRLRPSLCFRAQSVFPLLLPRAQSVFPLASARTVFPLASVRAVSLPLLLPRTVSLPHRVRSHHSLPLKRQRAAGLYGRSVPNQMMLKFKLFLLSLDQLVGILIVARERVWIRLSKILKLEQISRI